MRPFLFIYLFIAFSLGHAQGAKDLKFNITLAQAIEFAKKNSIEFKTAKNNSEVSYWIFKSYESSLYPSLNLDGTIPSYTKSINRITADDGTDIFISQNQSFANLSLSVEQNISFTGGTFSLSSSLSRIDIFSNQNLTNYSAIPLSLSYSQESIFYNPFKWLKKIETLKFEESKKLLIEEMEQISFNTTIIFFDVVLAEVKLENALSNKKNQDSIYEITKGRFEIGKLFQSDVLQSELSKLNAEKEVLNSKNELTLAKELFLEQIGYDKNQNYELIIPETLNLFNIDSSLMFNKALANKKLIVEHKRKLAEAKQKIEENKKGKFKIGVRGNFGFTQQNSDFQNIYTNLLNQQNFTLSLGVPIYSWGKRKADLKIAQSNLDLITSVNKQELSSLKRELRIKYLEWKEIELSVRIAKKASDIAVKRYDVSRRRFSIGKVTITELNIAQKEKDEAIFNYYQNLRNYWRLYYEIRMLTLYDFIKKENISY